MESKNPEEPRKKNYGPTLPPHLVKPTQSSTVEPSPPSTMKTSDRQYGPQLPTPKLSNPQSPKSLQEEYEDKYMATKKQASQKDLDDKIFDWERDMNSSVRRMSEKSARDLLNSSSLNDRFGNPSKKYL